MKVQEIKTARQALEAAEPAERAWAEKLLRRFPAGQREWLAGCGKRAGEILLNMQDPATRVYLLIKGEVNGISAQSSGMLYRFAHFSAPFLLGEFEAFSGAEIYRSTLVCASDCIFLWMPRESYLSWMRQDPQTLFWRTCEITASLSEQARSEPGAVFLLGQTETGDLSGGLLSERAVRTAGVSAATDHPDDGGWDWQQHQNGSAGAGTVDC